MVDHKKNLIFPKNFLWGTATSAHQIEGNNTNSDWWQWEQKNSGKILNVLEEKFRDQKFEPSGKCCDHYNRYKEDFDLIEQMNNNAYRMSIEWARIEPEKGKFDLKQVEHYKKVLQDLKKRKVKVMLTLHHFTNPQWFTQQGGWEKFKSVKYFKRYTKFVAKNLGKYVDYWITVNEPTLYADMSYLQGFWTPQKKSVIAFLKVYWNMARAHKKAYKVIHRQIDQGNKVTQVGVAQNVMSFTSYKKHRLLELFYIHFADRLVNHSFFDLTKKKHDFLGVNFYYRVRLKQKEKSLLPEVINIKDSEKEVSDMGWLIYPHGLFSVLMDFKDFNLPIFITENGIAAVDDKKREKFLVDHIAEVYRAIQNGVDVRGYFHWSLLDNFEWDKSFGPKFGLVDVNFKTLERKLKPSGKLYGEICKNNGLSAEMME